MKHATDAVSPPSPAETRPPRAAATLVIVREAADSTPHGIEVLLSRRAERGDHNSGAWVFPGGVVDAGDHLAQGLCDGLDDAAASARLGLAEGGLAYYAAAVRECFEESGLLYAIDHQGAMPRLDDAAGAQLATWRGALHRGERSLAEMCRTFGLQLALDRLIYLSHWLTPPARAKRFDTRFFLAAVPPAQVAVHDGTELVEQRWLRPADALARAHELKLLTPTQKTLGTLARFETVAALLEWAGGPREVSLIMPRVGTGSAGMRPVIPDEPAFDELGRLDPQGLGTASYELTPGAAVRLSPRLIRVTANNGSMMTGPGTNTYLVGGGAANEWAVIDPGPPDDAHVEAILAAAPGPIRWIFVTHTHKDHSPATVALQARTGAHVHGRIADHPQWQDLSFVPDTHLRGGERFTLPGPDGEASNLLAVHTPGHASNHLCYLLEEEKLLFTGDHVMQASTVVINPPDGDMAAYIASLLALCERDLDWLAPGHGFLMAQPQRAMRAIVAHRHRREAKVLAAVRDLGPASTEALLATVYADVPERLHAMALRSLTAHLFKLRDEAAVIEADGRWSLPAGGA
jgi:glyoxylase-like metal-dependent hydrolase (beta-lactamase superfamily II)/8-oxo-dGTP pyrophosphatase MutT (NUDIX family)